MDFDNIEIIVVQSWSEREVLIRRIIAASHNAVDFQNAAERPIKRLPFTGRIAQGCAPASGLVLGRNVPCGTRKRAASACRLDRSDNNIASVDRNRRAFVRSAPRTTVPAGNAPGLGEIGVIAENRLKDGGVISRLLTPGRNKSPGRRKTAERMGRSSSQQFAIGRVVVLPATIQLWLMVGGLTGDPAANISPRAV